LVEEDLLLIVVTEPFNDVLIGIDAPFSELNTWICKLMKGEDTPRRLWGIVMTMIGSLGEHHPKLGICGEKDEFKSSACDHRRIE
jgi:hypothetical protein